MLARGRADERVVHGTATDAQPGKLPTKGDRLCLAKEHGSGEVMGEQAEDISGRTTKSGR